ncbi:hypothetical protein [Aquibacillus salsiterrae]|uniref:Uncharacterized protein n=1 Tax=Aquibacillus salsiterrae TaxID=2950439 RepID=A0A9X3WC31_9BACI|nr:hypothetical protein [Aquibacillus salsiterrae]MDC3416652.1 hypothetical protein [Aquibacillus salsiterrae]
MKKTTKILLIVLSSLIVLLAGGGGWVYYTFNLKSYDTADAKVSEVYETDFVIDIPKLTSVDNKMEEADSDGASEGAENAAEPEEPETSEKPKQAQSTEPSTTTKANSSDNTESEQSASTNQEAKSTTDQSTSDLSTGRDRQEDDTLSRKEIKAQYKPAFKSLEVQATQKLNNLLQLAYEEYQTKKENDEKIDFAYFYRKYKTAADNLEAKTDQAFDQIYGSLVKDLKENGYSGNAANDFKDQYEEAKEQRKGFILDKAMGSM